MTHPTDPATVPSRPDVADALSKGGIVDITTTGRRSGEQRRIEIVLFSFDGHLYISGMPGRRSWYANLQDDPRFTLHLKQGVTADLPARARLVTDPTERRAILARVTHVWNREAQLEAYVAGSPLIEVILGAETALAA